MIVENALRFFGAYYYFGFFFSRLQDEMKTVLLRIVDGFSSTNSHLSIPRSIETMRNLEGGKKVCYLRIS